MFKIQLDYVTSHVKFKAHSTDIHECSNVEDIGYACFKIRFIPL